MSDFLQQFADKVSVFIQENDETLSNGLVREDPGRSVTFTENDITWKLGKCLLGHTSTGLMDEYGFRAYKKLPEGSRKKKITWQFSGWIYKRDQNFTHLDPSKKHKNIRWANNLVVQFYIVGPSQW